MIAGEEHSIEEKPESFLKRLIKKSQTTKKNASSSKRRNLGSQKKQKLTVNRATLRADIGVDETGIQTLKLVIKNSVAKKYTIGKEAYTELLARDKALLNRLENHIFNTLNPGAPNVVEVSRLQVSQLFQQMCTDRRQLFNQTVALVEAGMKRLHYQALKKLHLKMKFLEICEAVRTGKLAKIEKSDNKKRKRSETDKILDEIVEELEQEKKKGPPVTEEPKGTSNPLFEYNRLLLTFYRAGKGLSSSDLYDSEIPNFVPSSPPVFKATSTTLSPTDFNVTIGGLPGTDSHTVCQSLLVKIICPYVDAKKNTVTLTLFSNLLDHTYFRDYLDRNQYASQSDVINWLPIEGRRAREVFRVINETSIFEEVMERCGNSGGGVKIRIFTEVILILFLSFILTNVLLCRRIITAVITAPQSYSPL